MDRERGKCRHCPVVTQIWGRRGLCWKCYNTPAVRGLYLSRCGKRGVGHGFKGKVEPVPVCEAPGSDGKIEAMAARAERGESLFSDADTFLLEQLPSSPTPVMYRPREPKVYRDAAPAMAKPGSALGEYGTFELTRGGGRC